MYLRYVSKDFLEDVLWLTIDSHVLRPCRRTPFLLTWSRLLFCVHVEVLFGAERVFRRERKKKIVSFLSARRSYWAQRENSSEKKRKVKFWSERKAKDQESFLRFLFL